MIMSWGRLILLIGFLTNATVVWAQPTDVEKMLQSPGRITPKTESPFLPTPTPGLSDAPPPVIPKNLPVLDPMQTMPSSSSVVAPANPIRNVVPGPNPQTTPVIANPNYHGPTHDEVPFLRLMCPGPNDYGWHFGAEFIFSSASLTGRRTPPAGVNWQRGVMFQGNDGGSVMYGPAFQLSLGYALPGRWGMVEASAFGQGTNQAFSNYAYVFVPLLFLAFANTGNDQSLGFGSSVRPNSDDKTYVALERYYFDFTYRSPWLGVGSSVALQGYGGYRYATIFGDDLEVDGTIRQRVTQSYAGHGYFAGMNGYYGFALNKSLGYSIPVAQDGGLIWRVETGQLYGRTLETYREENRDPNNRFYNVSRTYRDNNINTYMGELGLKLGIFTISYRLDFWTNILGSERPQVNFFSHGLVLRVGSTF